MVPSLREALRPALASQKDSDGGVARAHSSSRRLRQEVVAVAHEPKPALQLA